MIASILTMSFACASSANADKTHTEKMDDVLKEVITASSPGLVVAVEQDGQTTYSNAIGLANLECAARISEHTVFNIASLAKQFSGYAVATLVKQGRLELSDPVIKHLSELGKPYQEITILDRPVQKLRSNILEV